ncbi:hypothetical protein SLA2020_325520 [Shorea laevis]
MNCLCFRIYLFYVIKSEAKCALDSGEIFAWSLSWFVGKRRSRRRVAIGWPTERVTCSTAIQSFCPLLVRGVATPSVAERTSENELVIRADVFLSAPWKITRNLCDELMLPKVDDQPK